MKPIAEVAMLTFKHGDTFLKCLGCPICERIKELRDIMNRPPVEVYKYILDKGPEMTPRDKKLLRDKCVPIDVINKYAKQKPKGDEEMAGRGRPKKQSETLVEKKEVTNAKKRAAKSNYEKAKKEVAVAIATDPSLTEKLQARIAELEEQMMEHYRKRVEAEEKVQNLEAAAEDLEKENQENAQKARQMEEEMNNFAAEVDEERERSRSYARECERLNDANKDLRMLLQESQRKEKLYAAALKEAL